MCFSATASFSAAAFLGAAGLVGIAKAGRMAELPLASTPLIFAVQQATEGVLWLTAPEGPQSGRWLASAFAVFALMLWPVLSPIAVALVEPQEGRRRLIYTPLLAGVSVAAYSAITMLSHPYLAWPVHHSLTYVNNVPFPPAMVVAYLISTAAPPVLSSHGAVRLFGLIIALGLGVSILAFYESFVSVWCFFAALGSITLLTYFRRRQGGAEPSIV